MRVKLKNEKPQETNILYEGEYSSLKEGNSYTVYGIEVIDGDKYYLICIEGDYTPRLYKSSNFELIDDTDSKYWNEDLKSNGRKLFEDWINFDDYLECFFNGVEYLGIDESDISIDYFQFYQNLIDNENRVV